jgi:hypothetical protein
MYASSDRHTTFLQVYPSGPNRLDLKSGAAKMHHVGDACKERYPHRRSSS